ncbi:hypothetical protein A9Q81_00755 [Gammaproteobacteria bacterium 42_54_T18]|nr:hypothetical protein A9Q81_00755 [Gammaproteobacteria bacterium 42_54_T18]
MPTRNFDPELAPYLPLIPTVIDFSTRESIRDFWARFSSQNTPKKSLDNTKGMSIENRKIAGLNGDPEIAIRIYQPDTPTNDKLPAIYEIHGGGFIIGDLNMQDDWCKHIAREVGAMVVSIDYRLAPESPFPAAPDDCYAGLCWLFEHADTLGIDASRVAIAGQSAGACLAVSTTLRARDLGGPQVCFQLLEVPVFDNRLETASMHEYQDTPMWNRPNAIWSWKHYLGSDEQGDISPYAAPARVDDVSGLPSTYISTMEFDPLRDEGIEFALRLMQAGIAVELHNYPGTFHGSTMITNAKVSQRNMREMVESLKNHLR